MGSPVILAVDPDPAALGDVERELHDRYARHYRVICVGSPAEAARQLADLEASGEPLALVLAGHGVTNGTFLGEVRRAHPHAKRAMLVGWGDWGYREAGDAILAAIEQGRIDHYVVRPAAPPDEQFHQAVSTFLLEWAEERRTAPYAIHVVGESWSGRAYELRSVLESCAFPHAFSLADSAEGRSLLGTPPPEELPVVILPDGTTLTNPTASELTHATGSSVEPEDAEVDLVIVGAGPAGLSAAVYGASEGFRTLVVDLAGIGGQARSSSMIRNYLGFPRGISGALLARHAHEQAWILGARFVFMHSVTALRAEADGLVANLSEGAQIRTRAVVLATGADYRRLGIPSLEALAGAGVFYGGAGADANRVAGQDVYVLGGANSAGQAALHLARFARSVTLVARAAALEAGMSRYLVRQLQATPNVAVRLGTEVVGGGGDGWLTHLVLRDRATGEEDTVEAQELFLAIGAHPRTNWLPEAIARDDHGFVLTGADLPDEAWPLEREPYPLETSMPGVLAVGDVRHGSIKRVASAVGEGSVAVRVLHRLLDPADASSAAGRVAEPTA
ncbi:MAG TPA: FAD-dependent oxidoreductase [Gaiella sp.]|jgi:thioredoxin reductase (NADPH)|nr:FAD-dependent oxidoreductase [Gaiella sp.]